MFQSNLKTKAFFFVKWKKKQICQANKFRLMYKFPKQNVNAIRSPSTRLLIESLLSMAMNSMELFPEINLEDSPFRVLHSEKIRIYRAKIYLFSLEA